MLLLTVKCTWVCVVQGTQIRTIKQSYFTESKPVVQVGQDQVKGQPHWPVALLTLPNLTLSTEN
jgi:hypothetical protein